MNRVHPATRAAAVHYFGATGVFTDLQPGDNFHFPNAEAAVFTKLNGGWFVDSEGRKFRTGRGTAIIRVVGTERCPSCHSANLTIRTQCGTCGGGLR